MFRKSGHKRLTWERQELWRLPSDARSRRGGSRNRYASLRKKERNNYREVIVLGRCYDLEETIEKVRELYSKGYNSMAIVDKMSFHDPNHSLIVYKTINGRAVKNPEEWLKVALPKQWEREVLAFRVSRNA